MIRITANTKAAQRTLQRIAEGVTPAKIDAMVHDEAIVTEGRLKRATPKKWTGATRAAWQIIKPQEGVRIVRNDSQAMMFLEHGTKAHGPVRAKALFIPLTRAAAFSDRKQFGTFTAQGSRGIVVRGGQRKGRTIGRRLKYGVDYVLAKWVKGIRARRIVSSERPLVDLRLKARFKTFVNRLILNG